ncbi:aspartyl-phosphate phosphatase Spo0E family protein [Alkalicoccobacillus plakortidis]|uniref:Aspartyl-phosphate phosphatase Spo0E family protein n=1 Tax=Alkalicoccobacillus plakortidis TaxID=444060 RepID=A0ABT0XQB4_9BACI|nr:aspartyl-phosphate phosphatase Spo0E family protein [Alkalicoccobacillus plakortidis]MCM2677895.1 aspartyl-phosphate phosphatase Spo0E family protein [Alkalicoccobacillus plakortidis]
MTSKTTHTLLKNIERVRHDLNVMALTIDLSSPDIISRSQELDHLLNEYKSIAG